MKKTLISLLATMGGAVVGGTAAKKIIGKELEVQRNMSAKHLALFLMMDRWVAVKQEGKNLADYLEKSGYKTIAVYGMSYAGERFVEELAYSNIQIKYCIDRNADNINSDIDIITLDDELEPVDAIIVTPIFFFDEIKRELSTKIDCPIVSLEDILYEV